MEGHHLGWGLLGVSHFHVVDGLIGEEWAVYDEMAMLAQLKLGALGISSS